MGGESKGRHMFKHDGLNTEDGLAYFQGNLARLGYDKPKTKKELIALLEEIVEAPTYVLIKLSTRKRKVEGVLTEMQNKRFIKALDSEDVTDEFKEDELTSTMGAVEATEEDSWSKGDDVQTDLDGTTYSGTIKSIDEDAQTALVKFEDGDKLDIDLDKLEVIPEEEPGLEKGDRVSCDIDGTTYEGTIKKVKGDSATIEFDDGDTEDKDLDELTKLEEKTGESEESPPCSLSKEKLTPPERRTVNKFAKTDEFDPNNYDSKAQLLCQIGDYHGLSGQFKSPSDLITAIKKAIKEES